MEFRKSNDSRLIGTRDEWNNFKIWLDLMGLSFARGDHFSKEPIISEIVFEREIEIVEEYLKFINE